MCTFFGKKPAAQFLLACAGMLIAIPARTSAQTGSESAVGYIDSAIPLSMFRLRYDSAYDNNRPTRAEFFYPKSRLFRNAPFFDSSARGPSIPESSVNYQDISAYLESAERQNFSWFVEAPVRFLDPERNANTAGFGDMNAGFKWAMICEPDRYVTFQFRTYVPTADPGRGLGTGHVSLEPALLFMRKLNDRVTLEGEFRDWIPIGGSDFAGNVIRYGIGLSATVYEDCRYRVTPVTELVGWTALNGKESVAPFPSIQDASGDTIVNLKAGVRLGTGPCSDIYVGYGRALTGDVWYRDILRVELRWRY